MDVGLVILDGWGLNPDDDGRDAVATARTPVFDRLWDEQAGARLRTDGQHVGLPEGQMGNSEVGHLTIGAGRVCRQESTRITDAIERWRDGPSEGSTDGTATDPPLGANPALCDGLAFAREHGGRVHLLGLVSDGGVHAYQRHIHALVEFVAEAALEPVVHAFTDGRDTDPTDGESFVADLENYTEEHGGRVATVSGRYYAMDRDENWERTHRAYAAMVERESEFTADTATGAVAAAYDRGTTDEFVEPTCVEGGPRVVDGDAVVFCNFRADRARQLTRMLAGIDPDWPMDLDQPELCLVTMTEYDDRFDLPVAFEPTQPEATLGETLARHGYSQLRIAETEKYAHVTYFLNGGRETQFDGEHREIVPSPDVPTYDRQPEMSAPEVTDRALERVEPVDVLVLNYANPDMVGHTGEFDAAVTAIEAVDTELGRLLEAFDANEAHALVTADHGNADEMGTAQRPHTAHTTNPVPFVYRPPESVSVETSARDGALADLAPTLLDVLGVDTPAEMTGRSLLVDRDE